MDAIRKLSTGLSTEIVDSSDEPPRKRVSPNRIIAIEIVRQIPRQRRRAPLLAAGVPSCTGNSDRYLTALPVRPTKTSVPVTAFR